MLSPLDDLQPSAAGRPATPNLNPSPSPSPSPSRIPSPSSNPSSNPNPSPNPSPNPNLNPYQASTCGSTVEYDSPLIESQAAILSRTFLDWYHEELEQVARVQHEYQCDWGHDEMWCSGAARLSEQLPSPRPACAIIRHSVDHHDTHSIDKVRLMPRP